MFELEHLAMELCRADTFWASAETTLMSKMAASRGYLAMEACRLASTLRLVEIFCARVDADAVTLEG